MLLNHKKRRMETCLWLQKGWWSRMICLGSKTSYERERWEGKVYERYTEYYQHESSWKESRPKQNERNLSVKSVLAIRVVSFTCGLFFRTNRGRQFIWLQMTASEETEGVCGWNTSAKYASHIFPLHFQSKYSQSWTFLFTVELTVTDFFSLKSLLDLLQKVNRESLRVNL